MLSDFPKLAHLGLIDIVIGKVAGGTATAVDPDRFLHHPALLSVHVLRLHEPRSIHLKFDLARSRSKESRINGASAWIRSYVTGEPSRHIGRTVEIIRCQSRGSVCSPSADPHGTIRTTQIAVLGSRQIYPEESQG